jgi:hypothetical protein
MGMVDDNMVGRLFKRMMVIKGMFGGSERCLDCITEIAGTDEIERNRIAAR